MCSTVQVIDRVRHSVQPGVVPSGNKPLPDQMLTPIYAGRNKLGKET